MRAFATERPTLVGDVRHKRWTGAPAHTPVARRSIGVEAVMRSDELCVAESEPLERVKQLVRRVGGVPVVDDDGRPVGVVSGGDLLRSPAPGEAPPTTAREVMSGDLFALPLSASVAQAAALMAYERVDLIVITDFDGALAGVVRALDVAGWCARAAGYLVDREPDHAA